MRPIFVMIVSHHLNTIYLLRRFAEVSGYNILTSLQSEISPDVVVVDADGADYQDVIRHYASNNQTQTPSVVVCAWSDTIIDQSQVYHLQKPVLLKDFQSVVQQAVAHQSE